MVAISSRCQNLFAGTNALPPVLGTVFYAYFFEDSSLIASSFAET